MTRPEIAALIAYIAGLDPRTARTGQDLEDQLDQWCAVLRDVPARAPHPNGRHWNAAHIAHRHVTTSPYPILPADIARPWAVFRADVIGRHTDPLPQADPDNVQAYRAELAGTRHAVATGQQQATTYAELAAAPSDRLRARLARVGEMPPAVREQIRQTTGGRIGKAKERFPELAVECPHPKCRARRHMPCKTERGRERRESTHDQRQQAYAALLARETA